MSRSTADTKPFLVQLLSSESWRARQAGAVILGRLKEPSALPTLSPLMVDKAMGVRVAARLAGEQIDPPWWHRPEAANAALLFRSVWFDSDPGRLGAAAEA